MKNIFAFLIFLVVLVSLGSVFADVIAPGTHTIYKCVKINNVSEFPDYVFAGAVYGPGGESQSLSFQIIDSSTCLNKGYKFNHFFIYAIKSSDFDQNKFLIDNNGDLSFDLSKAIAADTNIELNGETVSDYDPRTNENVEYKIASVGSKVILNKVKDEYNTDQSPQDDNSIVVIPKDNNSNDNEIILPNPPAQEKDFFSGIICFFMGLFGQTC